MDIDDLYVKERDDNSEEDDIIPNGDTSALLYTHMKWKTQLKFNSYGWIHENH